MLEQSLEIADRRPLRPSRESISPAPQRRPSLGLIGVGAFGEFCIAHLAGHFDVSIHDPRRDLGVLEKSQGVRVTDLATAAQKDIVLLAVAPRDLRDVARKIAPHLKIGSLVIDVCSIKTKPLAILAEELPAHAEIVGTHPLFGPRSGKDGIEGLTIAVCSSGSPRGRLVTRFLRKKLGLRVVPTTPERHDEEMAYVQGLTHLLSRIVLAMDVPAIEHTTATFDHLMRMVGMVRDDSDEIFRAITEENPFAAEVKRRLREAAQAVTTF
ncbi:prephenate dehydrogenase/arogenate dehydrogenase family protein [Microvirga flavescens]|uniref:prephenate dehydrogenase/arogenate dehydrogenase family protein n=1 Tax=Microvirga flavescens TaxID=2249811 RepID=UPI0013007F50|nr:prephenate dehydrogenase/arogenate dehydrogenase family protein [Microvirga flavescens]